MYRSSRLRTVCSQIITLTATLLLTAACASHSHHGHVDNSPCTWPYKPLGGEARLAVYMAEDGKTVVQRELVATDSTMPDPAGPGCGTAGHPPCDPHPHYFVKGRCIVELDISDNVCTYPKPFTCSAGGQSWCSPVRC